jgi:hypothetical protein
VRNPTDNPNSWWSYASASLNWVPANDHVRHGSRPPVPTNVRYRAPKLAWRVRNGSPEVAALRRDVCFTPVSGHRGRDCQGDDALARTHADHPQSVVRVLWGVSPSAGTARPHLLRISGARKSVVAVTGQATLLLRIRSRKSRLRCVLFDVRYVPVATEFRSAGTRCAKNRSSSLFSKAVVLARPRLIDRLGVIKLYDVLSTAANKERYECS